MKTSLIKSIIALSLQSKYGNVADHALYRHMGVEAPIAAASLNALYLEELITVRDVKGLRYIAPTSKAIKEYPSVRPVSRESCMTVFKCIMDMQEVNAPYHNVAYYDLYKKCAMRVGVVTFDNAIHKLLQAGYIKASNPTEKLVVYVATKKGVEMYLKAINSPAPRNASRQRVQREMSEAERQQQALLRELAQYTYTIKRYDRKLAIHPNYTFTADEQIAYTNACANAIKLQAKLNLA